MKNKRVGRYILKHRIRSEQKFGRKADPERPYMWDIIESSDDRQLLEDLLYKITDGHNSGNYKIFDNGEDADERGYNYF